MNQHTYRSMYSTWYAMKNRCNNPANANFKYYGARGIKVCKRWGSFKNFAADMGERPPGMTIDRINNDRGYEPGNCRWATRQQQHQNQRLGNMNSVKTHCIRGHPFSGNNLIIRSDGARGCRICKRIYPSNQDDYAKQPEVRMKCPECDGDSTVIDVRHTLGGTGIRRRRECSKGHRWATLEVQINTSKGRKVKDILASRTVK